MNGFNFSLKIFMLILISVGIVLGVIGAVIANFALIVAGAILMSIPLILKFINDLILEEWLIAIIPGLSLAAVAFLYIWTSGLSSAAADPIDRPVLWVVVGVGVIQLLWISLIYREG